MIPKDCQLAVCSWLDRDDLEELACVNTIIGEIVHDESLNNRKNKGELCIREKKEGHLFCMNNLTSKYGLLFGIGRSNVAGRQPRGYRKKQDKPYDIPSYFDFASKFAIAPSTTIPTRLFENLEDLLEKYYCDRIVLDRVRIDDQFLDYFPAMLEESQCSNLNLYEPSFHEDLDIGRFEECLLAAKLKHIHVAVNNQIIPPSFDTAFGEQFLVNLIQSMPNKPLRFRFRHEKTTHFWTPSEEALPIISNFDHFEMHSMRFDPDTLLKMIIIGLDNYQRDETLGYYDDEDRKHWFVSITEEFDRQHFSGIDTSLYRWTWSGTEHKLKKIETGFSVTFFVRREGTTGPRRACVWFN